MAAAALPLHPASQPGDSAPVRGRTSVGDFELTICSDGTCLLDGGAIFRVVPKTLWQKRAPADDDNRILLGLNTAIATLALNDKGKPVAPPIETQRQS